jgi:hypothetical protein
MSVVASLLSACSGAAVGADEPDLGPLEHITDARQIVLPLDEFRPELTWRGSPQDVAFALVVRDCLRGFGLDWPVIPAQPSTFDRSGKYGLLLADARERGYEPRPRPTPSETHQTITEDHEAVLTGAVTTYAGRAVPPGGCAKRANDEIAPPSSSVPAAPPKGKSYEVDSRVLAAERRWSACMKGKGYDYHDMWAANDSPINHRPKSAESRALALADAECRDSTRLIDTLYAADKAYEQQLIEENPDYVAAERRWRAEVDRNVARILAHYGYSADGRPR